MNPKALPVILPERNRLTPALSPGALDVIKVTALLAMLADHINTVFLHPPVPELYMAGRMAFPLFVLVWAVNVNRTPERLQHRATRLWIWAAVTQPVFALAFRQHHPWWALNILFVFAGVTQLLALKHHAGIRGTIAGVMLLAAMVCPLRPASYGLPGILLALSLAIIFSGADRLRLPAVIIALVSLSALNGITHIAARPAETLMFATLPTVLLPFVVLRAARQLMPAGSARFMPGGFFCAAYTGHLVLLGLMMSALSTAG
ncbi:TraX family protein [Superficieibacter sp. 1612_C1]|uniref:TraX family protein n=1 Tax=Superficieibacter sp. 1612_C1 TaxID=2780382 RepID=UPI0018835AC7|nr:TraX family protein [Superficieibacter sp. 1612_C1]